MLKLKKLREQKEIRDDKIKKLIEINKEVDEVIEVAEKLTNGELNFNQVILNEKNQYILIEK